jgi:DNA-binding NarL/FixJ family response regulator
VRIAAQGLSICPPELTARLLDRLAEIARTSEIRRHDRLTERQDKIARELSISPATVKNHVHAILGKFDRPRRSAIGSLLSGGNPVLQRA